MTFYNNKQIQSIILEAYTKPKYKVNLLDNNKTIIKEHSGVCVDDLQIQFDWKNNVLVKSNYIADGCAVFLASVDLAIDLFINKQKEDIIELLDIYFKMINTSQIADKDYEKLGALAVFKNVKNNFNRLECASIIYRAFRKEII